MDLLFNTSLTREELIQNFQALSAYLIPSVWQLPIRVVDVDIASLKFALLPPPKVDRKEFPESAVEIYEGKSQRQILFHTDSFETRPLYFLLCTFDLDEIQMRCTLTLPFFRRPPLRMGGKHHDHEQ